VAYAERPAERPVNEELNRTLVCSVLFIDIVDYSKHDVAEQVRLKQRFNSVLSSALGHVEQAERVIVDTGDGAAIAFRGDPERALYVALEVFDANVDDLPMRMGINLGPVSLMRDINGADNVIGDGINVAQRVMAFAARGELLVSRSFYEVVSLLSGDYASMFKDEGVRVDKHKRSHDVYSVGQAVRVARRVHGEQARAKTHQSAGAAYTVIGRTPAQVFDAGTHYMVSGYSEASVREAVEKLAAQGGRLISEVSKVGAKWLASVANPRAAGASVQQLGFKHIISAPTREAVEVKVRELLEMGASLVQEAELADGVWTAVCEKT
jgi:class 3 adenylate cyclase